MDGGVTLTCGLQSPRRCQMFWVRLQSRFPSPSLPINDALTDILSKGAPLSNLKKTLIMVPLPENGGMDSSITNPMNPIKRIFKSQDTLAS